MTPLGLLAGGMGRGRGPRARWSVRVLVKHSKFYLLTSDRPIIMPVGLADQSAYIALPVSPTLLFVAAHDPAFGRSLAGRKHTELAKVLNNSFKGWVWMTCVRFEDKGHPRTYALFIKDGGVIDSRDAVQTDACITQTYGVFDALGPARAGILGPLH
jgi:hypothetical protein